MAVRELTFDRFIIPAFAVKQMGDGFFVDVDKTFIPESSDIEECIKGKILARYARSTKDFTGGINNFIDANNYVSEILKMLDEPQKFWTFKK